MADNDTERISEERTFEDVPSNFFDDFENDEFLDGLEVIDSLPEEERTDDNKREEKRSSDHRRRSRSGSRLDDYIKPGSRRDPEKTKAAIRRDKEVKVKEQLAKHLESQSDIRPPGTELDDYYDDAHHSKVKKREQRSHSNQNVEETARRSPARQQPRGDQRSHWSSSYRNSRMAFTRHRHSPGCSPRRSPKFAFSQNPHYRMRHSPRRRYSPRHGRHSPRNSPVRSFRRTPRHSPGRILRRSPKRNRQHDARSSPQRRSRKRSHSGPHWSPRRSPRVSSPSDHYKGPSPKRYSPHFSQSQYNPDISTMGPQFDYTFNEVYNPYPPQTVPPEMAYQPAPHGMEICQPVPMPINPIPAPIMNHMNYMAPEPVPPPQMLVPAVPQAVPPIQPQHVEDVYAPNDALAQLVAEGKLSKEDYLKLTPSIKGGINLMDEKTRIIVMTRCNRAVNKLNNSMNPLRFLVDNKCSNEQLSLPQKYASPLKRQVPVEFEFTNAEDCVKNYNKQLIDNIVEAIGLEKSIVRTKVKKGMKSVGVQTTKPYCDMCDIRDSIQSCSIAVSTDPLFLTSTVHTQVVEQDLLNSKAIFNPSGSVADGAPISIAHLTPAQLVSQLAARAKTFQQAEHPPASNHLYPRRNQQSSHDGRGGPSNFSQDYRYYY